MNALKIGMVNSKFRGREDTDKLIAALEGLEMKEGDDFPQGDKNAPQGGSPSVPARVHLRDSRAASPTSCRWSTRTRTIFPPACKFA